MNKRNLLSLALCLMLLWTAAPAEETFTMGPFPYTLEPGYTLSHQDEEGFFAYWETQKGMTMLCVSLEDVLNASEMMGVTVDWIKEELTKSDSQFAAPILGDNPTLFAVIQEEDYLDALIACRIQEQLVEGFQRTVNPDNPVPQMLYDVMAQIAGVTDESLSPAAKEEMAALQKTYIPADATEDSHRFNLMDFSYGVPAQWKMLDTEENTVTLGIDPESQRQMRIVASPLPKEAGQSIDGAWLEEAARDTHEGQELLNLTHLTVKDSPFVAYEYLRDGHYTVLAGLIENAMLTLSIATLTGKEDAKKDLQDLRQVVESIDPPHDLLHQEGNVFSFSGIPWNTPAHEALQLLAGRTQRVMAQNEASPYHYVGASAQDFRVLDSWFPVCTVVLEPQKDGLSWWLECQLLPPSGAGDVLDKDSAVPFYQELLRKAEEAYGPFDAYSLNQSGEEGAGISQRLTRDTWEEAWNSADLSKYPIIKILAEKDNMTLSLEQAVSPIEGSDPSVFYTCWLTLDPPQDGQP